MPLVRMYPMLPSFGDLDSMFDNFGGLARFTPALDVYQTKDEVVVEAPLAGIDPEQVSVSIEGDVLTIQGQAEHKSEVDEKNYYRKEVRHGAFHRSIALPAAVNGDKARATYEQGILKVVITKEERAKPKTVKVEVK